MTFALYFVAFAFLFFTALNLLPTMGLPVVIGSAFGTIVSVMKAWNFLLPFSTFVTALIFVVTVDLLLFGWWAVKWLIGVVGRLQ